MVVWYAYRRVGLVWGSTLSPAQQSHMRTTTPVGSGVQVRVLSSRVGSGVQVRVQGSRIKPEWEAVEDNNKRYQVGRQAGWRVNPKSGQAGRQAGRQAGW